MLLQLPGRLHTIKQFTPPPFTHITPPPDTPLSPSYRLPAAYRLALAECARRGAWRELYAEQAARLAEHCGRITAKEGAKREAVNRCVGLNVS